MSVLSVKTFSRPRQVVAIQRSYSNLHFMRAIGASPPQPSKAAENDRADTKQHQGRRFGNNVDGAPDFASGELIRMKVNVRMASQNIRHLSRERRGISLRRVPFPADGSADTRGKWRVHHIVRVVVVKRCAEKSPDYRPIHSGRNGRTGMDVRGHQVVIYIGGLRTREIDVEDRRGKRHGRLSSVQHKRCSSK